MELRAMASKQGRTDASMKDWDEDTLLLFNAQPSALPLLAALEEEIFTHFPETKRRVGKTQISYYHRTVFACVSLARVKRKAELPKTWITLSLGLPYPLESPRAAAKTEAYPGRWTTHFVLAAPEDVDGELLSWLEEAYVFSERK